MHKSKDGCARNLQTEMADEPDNDTLPPRQSDEALGIARRHFILRGSHRLLYVLGADPKSRDYEPVCQHRCGRGERHPCYYRASHTQEGLGHKFTSECNQTS